MVDCFSFLCFAPIPTLGHSHKKRKTEHTNSDNSMNDKLQQLQQRMMNEFTEIMECDNLNNSTTSVEDEEYSSSGGSFNHNDNRSTPNHHPVYALSCGMVLPKRHRRRRSRSDAHIKTLLRSCEYGCNAVSNGPSSSKSSSDSLTNGTNRKRRHSQIRPSTPFPSLLTPNEPFQKYVHRVYASKYDANDPRDADPSKDDRSRTALPPSRVVESTKTHLPRSGGGGGGTGITAMPLLPSATFATSTAATTREQFDSPDYSCDIVLSRQILSMTDALEFSSKPHCLIEATAPHRVLHSNAALFALLLHRTNNNNHTSNSTTATSATATPVPSKVAASTMPQSSFRSPSDPSTPAPSAAPSSLSSSWEYVQSQINLLFGLCFASSSSTTTTTSTVAKKGIVTLYPVYSTQQDLEPFRSGSSQHGRSDSVPPRYYLIEVSNVEDDAVHPPPELSSSSLSSSMPISNEKRNASMDGGVPKLVIA